MRFLNGETTKLNKKYYNGKAVAYMQDTEAWSIYKDSQGYAEYAIGGPSLEMLYDSYIQTHTKVEGKYKYTVTGEDRDKNTDGATGSGHAGYQISWDGGTTWKTLTDNSAGYLSADTNNLYVVDHMKKHMHIGYLLLLQLIMRTLYLYIIMVEFVHTIIIMS